MTLGQKINHVAKAVAAFMIAIVSLVTALLATIPSDALPAEWAVWIQSALAFLTVGAVWLTTNGEKVATAVQRVEDIQNAVDDAFDQITDVLGINRGAIAQTGLRYNAKTKQWERHIGT